MKLPNLLIIGAQKAGTTTLYRDLLSQPNVFFPYIKEPTCLADDHVLSTQGLEEYAELYKKAKDSDVRGDASTGYARIPRFTGVPERASRVLGDDVQLVYLLREPVSRIVSHHHHVVSNERCAATVDEFIHDENHHAITYSRYAFQLNAWLQFYPLDRFSVLIFEEYVKNRSHYVEMLSKKLGFQADVSRIDHGAKYNAAKNRSRDKGLIMRFQRTSLYGQIRPLLPVQVRDRLRVMLAPKAPPPPPPPSAQTVEFILESLEDDQRELASILGRAYPIWDPDKVRSDFELRRARHGAQA